VLIEWLYNACVNSLDILYYYSESLHSLWKILVFEKGETASMMLFCDFIEAPPAIYKLRQRYVSFIFVYVYI
jgi:hypothetical protein